MGDNLKGLYVFLIGSLIGFLVGSILIIETDEVIQQYYKQKTLCEKTLPRNQVCEMKFVPKED